MHVEHGSATQNKGKLLGSTVKPLSDIDQNSSNSFTKRFCQQLYKVRGSQKSSFIYTLKHKYTTLALT